MQRLEITIALTDQTGYRSEIKTYEFVMSHLTKDDLDKIKHAAVIRLREMMEKRRQKK